MKIWRVLKTLSGAGYYLDSTDVVKETERFVYVTPCQVSGYAARLDRCGVHFTPEDAIDDMRRGLIRGLNDARNAYDTFLSSFPQVKP